MSLAAALALAAAVWLTVFRFRRATLWTRTWIGAAALIGGAVAILAADTRLMTVVGPVDGMQVGLGIIVGGASVAVTHIGVGVISRLFPAFARQLGSLYGQASGTALQMAAPTLVMAVGEELLFRGVVQGDAGFVVAVAAYIAAQLLTGSWGLLIAALFGGVVWGGLVAWQHGLVAAIVAHALWTTALLVLWPLPSQRGSEKSVG